MLNYLWAGMIVISIVVSLFSDITDEINNRYDNGKQYTLSYEKSGLDHQAIISVGDQQAGFDADQATPFEIQIKKSTVIPEHWKTSLELSSKEKEFVRITVQQVQKEKQQLLYTLPEVHWVKLNAISTAAFEMAEFAIKLAIGLAGIMALWLGLMKIAEQSGLIGYFVRLIYPLLKWLFPSIDKEHPVLGSISLNMAANMLGLGNAATPMGIKAMQQLQALNKHKKVASDEMCMFLAINTSSVQLLPPVTLIAILGTGVVALIVPIIIATSVSTVVAIIVAKWFARRQKNVLD